jgi:transposase
MTETKLEDVLAALRVGAKSGGLPQFTAAARGMAATYAKARMASGVKVDDVAAELKLNTWTLQRWLQRHARGEFEKGPGKQKAGFARVKVREPAPAAVGRLVVHGARGVRVEGLTLENIAALLERLGCSA